MWFAGRLRPGAAKDEELALTGTCAARPQRPTTRHALFDQYVRCSGSAAASTLSGPSTVTGTTQSRLNGIGSQHNDTSCSRAGGAHRDLGTATSRKPRNGSFASCWYVRALAQRTNSAGAPQDPPRTILLVCPAADRPLGSTERDIATRSSGVGRSGQAPIQSEAHSATLPNMSNRPHGFGCSRPISRGPR